MTNNLDFGGIFSAFIGHIDQERLEQLAHEIQQSWRMTGLYEGIYKDFAIALIAKYLLLPIPDECIPDIVYECESCGAEPYWIIYYNADQSVATYSCKRCLPGHLDEGKDRYNNITRFKP